MKNFFIFFSIGVLFLIIVLSQFLINVHIDCKSQYGDCPIEILEKISPLNGKKIFFVRSQLKKILSSDLLVSDYSLQFKLPNIIHIDLLVKKPLFALKNGLSNSLDLVDQDGNIISTARDSELPTLIVNEDLPKVGQKASDENLFALKLINGVYEMYQIRNGEVQGDTLLVDLPGPVRVIFPLVDADRDLLLGSLRLIYSDIQNGENKGLYTQIDMRYKNPVLR